MRRQFPTVETAEEWARSLGVEADYSDRLDIANLSNEMLAHLAERSLILPDHIEIRGEPFLKYGRRVIDIPAASEQGTIRINPAAGIWLDLERRTAEQYSRGWWSTGHILHLLYHEAGHVAHYKADPSRFERLSELRDSQKTIVSGEVSRRAAYGVHEFMAEVFAGLIIGRKFSGDILRWYKRRGGIIP